MIFFGNFIGAVASILNIVLNLYMWIVIIAVVLSWVNPHPQNDVIRQIIYTLHVMTAPVFNWVRRKLPFTVMGGLDLSPMVVILAIIFLQQFLVRSLMGMAVTM